MTELALCAICGEQVNVGGSEPTISSPDGTFVHRRCQEALEGEPDSQGLEVMGAPGAGTTITGLMAVAEEVVR